VAGIVGSGVAVAQSPETSPPAEAAPWPTPATGVTGNVDIHGSSTVAPISTAVAEAFQGLNPDWGFAVGDEGTGAGFTDFFCTGGADIADASRAISEEESAACEAAGVTYQELLIGYDGLAIITSAENTAIECLTLADLYALIGPESNDFDNWMDAQALATELGSTTTFPDAPLSITGPGDESGTYTSFIELALADFIEERGQDETTRDPGGVYVASPNDNVIIEGVAGFPSSLGWVGLAYAEQAAGAVKILGVDGGEGCITPDATTVGDGTYPLSRPLFIYPSLTRLAENPAIAPYVDYYLSDEGIANVTGVGYVSAHPDEFAATRAAWAAAKGE
jgi:phosphate transport system substrate-binding protein